MNITNVTITRTAEEKTENAFYMLEYSTVNDELNHLHVSASIDLIPLNFAVAIARAISEPILWGNLGKAHAIFCANSP